MTRLVSEHDLDAARATVQTWAVLLAWSQNGLLEALADSAPRSAAELPGDERAIAVTAPILANAGVLVRYGRKGGDVWSLSPSGRRLWDSGALALGHAWNTLGDLTRLDRVLSGGGPVTDAAGVPRTTSGGVRQHDPDASRRFLDRLHRRSAEGARITADAIAARLPEGGSALDLGGGHGRYASELSTRGFAVTLFDRALVVGFARERYGDTLSYRIGDFTTDDLGGPYDAVLLSNIVHGLSEAELDELLPRLRRAVHAGGVLALKDMFVDDTGTGPAGSVGFGLTMLLYTEHGRAYSGRELAARLHAVGFADTDTVAVVDEGFQLMFAQ